ncbi:hypothetical protein CJF31_00002401 [Rutstroemia sp. NJR-2017a BVV2]|nr:hypothetical protein CJF31_00002401 [Rutstroemia sp. NJR-2017a BVV2]
MPLMKQMFPSRESTVERPSSRASKASSYDSFEFDDQSALDSDMEGSILNRPRPKKKASVPAVPPRSSMRSSAMLNTVMSELKGMDGFSVEKELEQEKSEDPHESYLSSEEDASLSDDGADSLLDFESASASEYTTSRVSSRGSGQDTARVVSFILVSKPKVIEIPPPTLSHSNPTSRNSSPVNDLQMRHSVHLAELALRTTSSSRRSSPLRTSSRRLSLSSISALSQISTTSSAMPHNPSKLNTHLQPESAGSNPSPSHAFLSSDPFPSPSPYPERQSILLEPEFPTRRPKSEHHERPKTPNSLMEGLQGLTRTLTRGAKKRPSMPKLNLAYTPGVVNNASRTSLLTVDEYTEKDTKLSNVKRSSTVPIFAKEDSHRASVMKETQSAVNEKAPMRYEDIMRTVIKEPPPGKSPGLNSPRTGFMGFGMGSRRKSMKK